MRGAFVPCLHAMRRWSAGAAFLLAGCATVGPDFHPPSTDSATSWHSEAVAQSTQSTSTADLSPWWKVFGDAGLEQLMSEADAQNNDLKIAGLRVLEARAQLGIAQSGRYPQVQQIGASALYTKNHQHDTGLPGVPGSWQFGAGFDIGWELDFWGRFRRAIESADAAYFASEANREDVLVLLHAQVADTYFVLRTAEARLRIAKANAELQRRSFEITERLFKSGETDELDFQQARTQYLSTSASIPELEGQIELARHALSVLVGRPPGPLPELDVASDKVGYLPLVDKAVVDDVPAQLLLRRPDLRAAQWQMAAQSALIGVAKADLYPSVSLVGTLSWSASSLSGSPSSLLLGAGPSISWNIFDHGRITNNVRVQDARLQQLTVAYEKAVLNAAREADDAATGLLTALHRDGILHDAEQAAQRSLSLANTIYREGYSDFQRVLDAQRALSAQQDAYIVNRGNAVGSLIALYKAMGGGWHTNAPLVDPATRQQMEQRTNWDDLLGDKASPTASAGTTTP